jgi:hypothetical protein
LDPLGIRPGDDGGCVEVDSGSRSVDATGDTWPQTRRELYATQDGEVIDVLRGHEQTVTANETLIVLRSPGLDLELQKTRGEF